MLVLVGLKFSYSFFKNYSNSFSIICSLSYYFVGGILIMSIFLLSLEFDPIFSVWINAKTSPDLGEPFPFT